jgi:hypothetical protein
VTGGKVYRFRVLARNIYGSGKVSDDLQVTPDDAPGKGFMPVVQLDLTDPTSVHISWDQPIDHSASITKYDIMFMTSSGDFVAEPTYCLGTGTTVITER